MELTERARAVLTNLPPSPLLERITVVDAFLDILNETSDPEERHRLELSLAALPRSVVVDRVAVADALLDVMVPGGPPPLN